MQPRIRAGRVAERRTASGPSRGWIMGQRLHVETPPQDSQQRGNGGETPDSFSSLSAANSFANLRGHLEGSQSMENLTNGEVRDGLMSAVAFLRSDLLLIFTTREMLIVWRTNLCCSATRRRLAIAFGTYSRYSGAKHTLLTFPVSTKDLNGTPYGLNAGQIWICNGM